jgi:cation diffusion facilitator family transporter
MISDIVSSDIKLRRRAAIISIVVAISLLMIKFVAYYLTGSAAVLSDALESIINVVASGFAFLSIIISARPPDESHPYGHGKIEFFSAGFEGALIVLAAIAIIWAAVPTLLHPKILPSLDIALILLIVGGAVNWFLGVYLIRTGKKSNSATLIADGKHVQTDAVTSAGVIIGLLLVWLTGWDWLDPVVAILVALNILRSGWHLLKEAIGGLMDEADPEFLAHITDILQQNRRPEWIAPHELRSWRSGAARHIDFHLVAPCYWQLYLVHQAHDDIQNAVLQQLDVPGEVTIHFDPCSSDYCPMCSVESCPVRHAPFKQEILWTPELLVAGPPYPTRPPRRLQKMRNGLDKCLKRGRMRARRGWDDDSKIIASDTGE